MIHAEVSHDGFSSTSFRAGILIIESIIVHPKATIRVSAIVTCDWRRPQPFDYPQFPFFIPNSQAYLIGGGRPKLLFNFVHNQTSEAWNSLRPLWPHDDHNCGFTGWRRKRDIFAVWSRVGENVFIFKGRTDRKMTYCWLLFSYLCMFSNLFPNYARAREFPIIIVLDQVKNQSCLLGYSINRAVVSEH